MPTANNNSVYVNSSEAFEYVVNSFYSSNSFWSKYKLLKDIEDETIKKEAESQKKRNEEKARIKTAHKLSLKALALEIATNKISFGDAVKRLYPNCSQRNLKSRHNRLVELLRKLKEEDTLDAMRESIDVALIEKNYPVLENSNA